MIQVLQTIGLRLWKESFPTSKPSQEMGKLYPFRNGQRINLEVKDMLILLIPSWRSSPKCLPERVAFYRSRKFPQADFLLLSPTVTLCRCVPRPDSFGRSGRLYLRERLPTPGRSGPSPCWCLSIEYIRYINILIILKRFWELAGNWMMVSRSGCWVLSSSTSLSFSLFTGNAHVEWRELDPFHSEMNATALFFQPMLGLLSVWTNKRNWVGLKHRKAFSLSLTYLSIHHRFEWTCSQPCWLAGGLKGRGLGFIHSSIDRTIRMSGCAPTDKAG